MKARQQERIPEGERCLNRITSEKTTQLFGDGVHRFFLEQRCNDRRMDGRPICIKCAAPNTSIKQYARTFPRGLITEPIPPHVHLFDSPWYHEHIKLWGGPNGHVIAYALEFQQEARRGLDPILPSKVAGPIEDNDMPPKQQPKEEQEKRKGRPRKEKPQENPPELPISEEVPSSTPVKRIRRPRIKKTESIPSEPMEPMESTTYPPSQSLSVLSLFQEQHEDEKETKEAKEEKPKRKVVKRKPKEKSPSAPVEPIHKDSCIPTHLEQSVEEQSLSDYDTEIVTLSIFILENTVYFRDSKKNKLYRRIKEKTIGPYVGRYDPQTDSIVTDVPDSDDENDENDENDE